MRGRTLMRSLVRAGPLPSLESRVTSVSSRASGTSFTSNRVGGVEPLLRDQPARLFRRPCVESAERARTVTRDREDPDDREERRRAPARGFDPNSARAAAAEGAGARRMRRRSGGSAWGGGARRSFRGVTAWLDGGEGKSVRTGTDEERNSSARGGKSPISVLISRARARDESAPVMGRSPPPCAIQPRSCDDVLQAFSAPRTCSTHESSTRRTPAQRRWCVCWSHCLPIGDGCACRRSSPSASRASRCSSMLPTIRTTAPR